MNYAHILAKHWVTPMTMAAPICFRFHGPSLGLLPSAAVPRLMKVLLFVVAMCHWSACLFWVPW